MVQPIFVIGSARSGTTLIGNYIGNCPQVCDLGEYFGFYFTHDVLVDRYKRVPTPFKDKFLHSIQEHAADFANSITNEQGVNIYCDSTPWNLLVADKLSKKFHNAIFILCIRHYSGVIQSLERSYNDGYLWAGSNYQERAEVYRMCYSKVHCLPLDRTVAISYDGLCANPEETLVEFKKKLKELGIDASTLSDNVFVKSYATNSLEERPTLATYDENMKLNYSSIPSYNSKKWTREIEDEVYPVVRETDALLTNIFAEYYKKPIGYYF